MDGADLQSEQVRKFEFDDDQVNLVLNQDLGNSSILQASAARSNEAEGSRFVSKQSQMRSTFGAINTSAAAPYQKKVEPVYDNKSRKSASSSVYGVS